MQILLLVGELVVCLALALVALELLSTAVLRIWLHGYEKAGARKVIYAPTKHSARSLKKWLVRRGRHYPVFYPGCKGKPL